MGGGRREKTNIFFAPLSFFARPRWHSLYSSAKCEFQHNISYLKVFSISYNQNAVLLASYNIFTTKLKTVVLGI